jgi:hypothetical protein
LISAEKAKVSACSDISIDFRENVNNESYRNF